MATQQLKVNVYRINSTNCDAYLMSFPVDNIVLRPVPSDKIAFSNSLNVYGIIQWQNDQYWVKETVSQLVTTANA